MSATSGRPVEEIKWQQHNDSMTGHQSTGAVPRIDHGTLRIITEDGEKVVKPFSDVSPGGTLNGYHPSHNGAASVQITPPQSPSNAYKVGRKDESQTTPRAHNYYEKMFGSPEAGITSFTTMVDPKTPVKDSFSDIPEGLCPLPPTASPRKPPRVRIQPSTLSSQAESPQLQTGLTPMAAHLNLSGVPAGTASTMFGPSPQASPRSAYQQVQQSLITTEPSYLLPMQTLWWNADPRTMPDGLQTYGQPLHAQCPQTVHSSNSNSNSMAGYPVGLVPINSAPLLASQQQPQQQYQHQQYQQHFQTHGPLASGVSRGGMEHQLPQPNFLWPIYTERDGVHCPPPPQVLHRSPNKESGKAHMKPSQTPTPVTPAPRQGPAQLAAERSLKTGLSSIVALQNFGHLLTPYEKGEILQYPEVWYVGKPGCRKLRGPPSCARPHCVNDTNTEYDDSRGDYRAMVGDHVHYRYEIVGTLGKGSFGQVLKCIDHATGTTVALKVIRNKRRFQKQARIEASLLGTIMAHMPDEEQEGVHDTIGPLGIVQMLDHFVFRSHLCITFELLGANLYEHIKAGGFAGCSPELVWSVGIQVLRTLSFLKSLNIVHCDLKPENILLPPTIAPGSDVSPSQTQVKVIDFGSSCYVDQRVFTYIQSRFYRAPEVILGLPYGPAIDMWSIACVLAELLTGAPLFPGEDETEQVACITEILGPPPVKLLKGGTRASLFFDVDSGVPRGAPPNSQGKVHRPGSVAIETALRGRGSALFLDFLKKCLLWDPEDRLTPEQALQHPWLAGKVNPKQQTTNLKCGNQRESSRSSVMRYLVPNKSNNKTNACSGKGPLGSAAAALGINIF